MRSLLTSVLTLATLLVAAASALGWYGSRHHLPEQQMEEARVAGDGCFLFLGDSRMVAGLDARALHRALSRIGSDRCHVQLAIGATDVGGMYLTTRTYLSYGHLPRAAVIGKAGDSLVSSGPARPEDMIGNNAIHLTWSRPDDVFDEVPEFPETIGSFDAGFRFLLARATPLGRYQSLVSIRVQRFEDWVLGQSATPRNTFGALNDMVSLEVRFRARARENLSQALHEPDSQRYGRWFEKLIDLLARSGIAPIIVELPMPSDYRVAVTMTPEAARYQTWLAEQVERRGGGLLDLSAAPWVEDQMFMDQLHLGEKGAARASEDIGAYLGARFPP